MRIDEEAIDRRLREMGPPRGPAEDRDLALIELAMFVEETFGLALADEDIAPETLGSAEAIRRLVLDRSKA